MKLDRRGRPLYRQVADDLREKIRSGGYPADSSLPAEQNLAAAYGVGRDTVRDALALLRSEALIVTERGFLSRVRSMPPRRAVTLGPSDQALYRVADKQEQVALDLPDGVGVVEITHPGREPEVVPADEVVLVVATGTTHRTLEP